jgi:phosphoglycerol transferase MdoB-like AlkP superfamily enzyme
MFKKTVNNFKYIFFSALFSGVLFGLFWFNVEYLTNLFFNLKCEGFGCLGLSFYYLFEYVVIVLLVLLIEIIILYKKLVNDRLKNMLLVIILTTLVAISVVVVNGFLYNKKETKAVQNAYQECLDFAEKTNTSVDYCKIYLKQ